MLEHSGHRGVDCLVRQGWASKRQHLQGLSAEAIVQVGAHQGLDRCPAAGRSRSSEKVLTCPRRSPSAKGFRAPNLPMSKTSSGGQVAPGVPRRGLVEYPRGSPLSVFGLGMQNRARRAHTAGGMVGGGARTVRTGAGAAGQIARPGGIPWSGGSAELRGELDFRLSQGIEKCVFGGTDWLQSGKGGPGSTRIAASIPAPPCPGRSAGQERPPGRSYAVCEQRTEVTARGLVTGSEISTTSMRPSCRWPPRPQAHPRSRRQSAGPVLRDCALALFRGNSARRFSQIKASSAGTSVRRRHAFEDSEYPTQRGRWAGPETDGLNPDCRPNAHRSAAQGRARVQKC